MPIYLHPDISEKIRALIDSGHFADETDVIDQALDLLAIREKKLERLRTGLAIGEVQEHHGDMFELTPERVDQIKQYARQNWRNGKPVKDAVKP